VIISRELVVSGLRMVAVAEGRVIAASVYGKVKTIFQIIAIVAFILRESTLVPASWAPAASATAWFLMGIALVLTVVSAVDYFYHARHIITGPWSGDDPDAVA
jgi:phosphatidylglycerophosphate synthase